MGLFDGIREVLGIRAEADATRNADPEDLFGMSTAYITMEAELGYEAVGEAALCFSEVDNTDFRAAVDEVHEILEFGAEETGTEAEGHTDDYGYSWVVLRDDDYEDLVTSLHFAADTLIEHGYGSRLLAAVFGFERDGDPAYWVYSFRRGSYYPFAPTGTSDRDSGAEFKLESNLDGELEVESDKEYWYPLWPDAPGKHPWE
ncbi:hypothetical protein NGM10_07855 [Halorussus salilacus]|uniref:PspA-associated protein PspAB n=1 Tax=Halorussus salilacus TaxID=2953750 RepID=UPI00209F6E03|nr:hypothetical protein [Halorussus salilacus]USZ66660.1 hypothetical protein NGM10_07855 [Halorussus salilacus]